MLYFDANDLMLGRERWKSDGTAAGTVRVADIRPGGQSSSPGVLAVIGSALFFSATDGLSGVEMWKTDGSLSGTLRITDINPGSADSYPGQPADANGIACSHLPLILANSRPDRSWIVAALRNGRTRIRFPGNGTARRTPPKCLAAQPGPLGPASAQTNTW